MATSQLNMRTILPRERVLLRDLAREVAELAAQPIMAERRAMWKRHNRLERVRPMVLVFPEGAWRELLPHASLSCETEWARDIEWLLRYRLYYGAHLPDDSVIEREWVVKKVVSDSGWGLTPHYLESDQSEGAWAFDPVLTRPGDLERLRHPEVHHDEAASAARFEEAQELFGDILDVRLQGIAHISFHLMSIYCRLRGLEQAMVDMYEDPSMLHEAMAILEEGHHRLVKQYQEMNLLELNNDQTYHSSGGVGYTDELPSQDYDGRHVRPCDMWSSAESQELTQVSPDMHEEFALQYERRLLAPFGLNGYGCCDDLTDKLDYVFQVRNMRRISISPWADVSRCAEKLQDRYIFSWKPHPAHLVGEFDETRIRAYIRHTLEATRGCVIEMILKDTHTCEHRPERFTRWTKVARELAEEFG